MVFHWGLSDSKSLQVSRTLHSILSDLNDAVDWMVSTCPLISKSSSSCTKLLMTVPNTPITIGITVTFMFHRFFSFFSKVEVLISLFAFLSVLYPMISRNGKVHYSAGSLFLLTITRSGRLAEIGWSVCISKSQIIIIIIIGIMVRVFPNGPGDVGSTPGRVIPNTLKMVLDTALLNTQQYKVRIKGKVQQSRKRISAILFTFL